MDVILLTKSLLSSSQKPSSVKKMSQKWLKLTSVSDYSLFPLLLLLKLLKQTTMGFTMFYDSGYKVSRSSTVSVVLDYAKAISLVCAVSLLIACGSGGGSESTEQTSTPETFTTIQGSVMKGVIVNGIVQAYLIESQAGAMVKSDQALDVVARTNERGEYQFKLPGQFANRDIVVEITADSQTQMTCDVTGGCGETAYGDLFSLSDGFTLKTAVTGVNSGETYNAHLSPLSHMALAYASSNSDGLTSTSISNSFSHIETLMDLEQGAMQLAPADITDLERYSTLSKTEIELGVISAAFLGLVNSPDWDSIEEVLAHVEQKMSGSGQLASVNLGTLPDVTLDDLFYNATQISDDLLDATEGGHAEALSIVSAEASQSYQEMSQVPQTVDPVVVSAHPQGVTVDESEQALFSVAASGGGTLTFQWQKNGADILGENGPSLIVNSVQLADAGQYAVIVSNSVGSVISLSALLVVQEVIEPVIITSQPTALTVVESTQANFSVEVIGGGELVYQWRKGGVAIAGATTASLNLSDVALSDAGSYDLIVSNSVSSVASFAVALIVNEQVVVNPVAILSQPQALEVTEGEQATFLVTTEGSGELVYQWRKGGVAIAGATSARLNLSDVALSDAGSYDLVVSNSVNSVASVAVALIVNEQVVVNPLAILSQPQALEVTEGEQATFSVTTEGSGELVYQWRKEGVEIAGATSASLTLSDVALSDAGSYDLVVSNSVNSVASVAVDLIVNEQVVVNPLTILSQPQALEVTEGEQATFSVTAEGGAELSYQWRKDGIEINGATASSIVLDTAALSDVGLYDVVISNSEVGLTSTAVSLGVNTVVVVLNSVQLSWDTPLKRDDGTDLELYEINGYVIRYGTNTSSLDQQVNVLGVETGVLIESLVTGTYYFSIATIDSDGVQGAYSAQIQQIIL